MNRYIKYKQVARIQLFADDDVLKTAASSVYKLSDSTFPNSKQMRFNLNGALNHVKLSNNARIYMEGTHMPNLTNLRTTIIRLVTSTDDNVYDSKKRTNGNPVLCCLSPNTQIYNSSELFHNLSIPSNFLEKGFIELEIESYALANSVDFITGTPFRSFFISLVIVDIDKELTSDMNLAPPINMKNYNINMPIRQW